MALSTRHLGDEIINVFSTFGLGSIQKDVKGVKGVSYQR
jgi:hypothetical protein